jgi:hypothetical protein
MAYETGTTGDSVSLLGTVASATVLEGSKSEHVGPILRTDEGAEYRLHMVGGNPFDNKGFDQWMGQRVAVSGSWRNGVVRVARGDVESIGGAAKGEPEAQLPGEEPDPVSRQHEEFLGEDALGLLRHTFDATLYPVVHEQELAVARFAPFVVGAGVQLSAQACQQIADALLNEHTWVWEWVSRHMAMPQHLFVLRNAETEVVVAFDAPGKKLGFIKGERVSARDFVPSSAGVAQLETIVVASFQKSVGNP